MKNLGKRIKVLVAVGLFVFLVLRFDIDLSSLVTGIVGWPYLIAAALMPLTLVPFMSMNRWQSFLQAVGISERLAVLWSINWISMFQGLVLPSSQGFDLLRIYHIERRHAGRRGLAGSTVVIERLMGLILLCLLSLAALPFVVRSADLWPLLATVLAISAAVVLALSLILSKRLHGWYTGRRFSNPRAARILDFVDQFHGAVVHFPFGKVLPRSLLWIAGFQLAVVLTVYLVFLAYGSDLPFVLHMAVFPMIALLSMVPITIGGFGVREGLFVYFYSLFGVPPAIAVGASIVQYLLLVYVPAMVGGVLFLKESLRGRQRG